MSLSLSLCALSLLPLVDSQLEELAALCGTEIEWAADWEEAAARAREQDRLIFVRAMLYPSFAMTDPDAATTFMDPYLVELVNARFVPWRMNPGDTVPFAATELYGMGPLTFGRGFLIVTPDGEVVRDGVAFPLDLLLSALEDERAGKGERVRRAADPVVTGRALIAQGRLAEARELLEPLEEARAALLLATLHRRQRDLGAARAALARARALDPDPDLGFELELEAAILCLRAGENAAGRDALTTLLRSDPQHARASEARYWHGVAVHGFEGATGTRRVWSDLIATDPDSRWAWKAAGVMTGTGFALGGVQRASWPDVEVRRSGAWHAFRPLPVSKASVARADATAWLLAHQRADGSWASPTEIARSSPEEPSDFVLAATAICTQALLRGGANEEAVERGLQHVLVSYEHDRKTPRGPAFLDYKIWSRAYVLRLLAAAVQRELVDADDLAPTVAALIDELRDLRLDDGGWSYYVTNDLEAGASPTAAFSISFTTAAAVLALQDAAEAGLDIPLELIDGGLDALEIARLADKSFSYFALPAGSVAPTPSGSAGRGPACTLALYRAARASLDDLRNSLDTFAKHRNALGRERGKSLMHCGPEGEGSHYLMFDYATAAEALTRLEPGDRPRYRTAVLEELLQARNADGAYLDNPLIGWASCTGLALDALVSCERGRH